MVINSSSERLTEQKNFVDQRDTYGKMIAELKILSWNSPTIESFVPTYLPEIDVNTNRGTQ